MKTYAKKLYYQLNSSTNSLGTYDQVEQLGKFAAELQPKSYHTTYKNTYLFAVCMSYFSQLASLVSSYSYFYKLFTTSLQHLSLVMGVTMLVLVVLEVAKRTLTKLVATNYFALQQKLLVLPLLVVSFISLVSMYASVVGGGTLGVDTKKVTTTESKFDRELAVLRTEIAQIQARNTYKGQTYLPKKEKALVHQKEKEVATLKEQKASELATVHTENEHYAQTYQYGFAGIELLFFGCMYFIFQYKRKSVLENMLHECAENQPTPLSLGKNEQLTNELAQEDHAQSHAIPNQSAKIGFQYDFTHLKNATPTSENSINDIHKESEATYENRTYYTRKCLHCGNDFLHNHKKQKYCADKCRVAAWEAKTKRTLKFKPKNVVPRGKQYSLF